MQLILALRPFLDIFPDSHETEYPPRIRGKPDRLRLRRRLSHSLHQAEPAPWHLRGLPPIFHRPAEVRRHRRPRREIHQALRRHQGHRREARPREEKIAALSWAQTAVQPAPAPFLLSRPVITRLNLN